MSELIQKHDNRATIRWKLLTGVSALALTAYVSSAGLARAEDASQPQIWIELGGQLNRLQDGLEAFSPAITAARPSIFSPSQKFEKPPLFGFDEEGKISFQPDNSDWVFAASIRYGRAGSNRHVRQQTYPATFVLYNYTYQGHGGLNRYQVRIPYAAKFADTVSRQSESHTILDFQAGKDVGLGLFGSKDGTSVVSAGVRFAQFKSKSNISLKSDPDWHFIYTYYPSYVSSFGWTTSRYVINQHYHSHMVSLKAKRNFHGVGPSISWNASLPFAGNAQDGELEVDWGVNAALLFGRQKAQVHHQTTVQYGHAGVRFTQPPIRVTTTQYSTNHTRTRNITVPNVGGFAGVSWKYDNAKVSFGYKADFFFNVIDGGIDARKNENRGFFGPYASISVGLGD